MITLFDYQETGVKMLRGAMINKFTKLCMVAATGAGKTVIFSFMATSAVNRGKRVLILSDRDELLKQSGGALEKFNMKPIAIERKRKLTSLNGMLYVGMVETLARRLKDQMYVDFLNDIDLIVLDECHKQVYNKLFPYITNPKTIVIGATATPHRDKNMTCMSDFYEAMVEICKISDLIARGFLCKPITYGIPVDLSDVGQKGSDFDAKEMGDMYNETKLFEGVVQNYESKCPGKKALIFASNIDSSKTLITEFIDKGYDAKHLDSEMPDSYRQEVLTWFKNTPGAILSNVGILNTGFDEPTIEAVILYRATMSLSLFLQMVGRGSRTIKGFKSEFYILDFGNNIKRHGFWEEDREWSLKKKKKTKGLGVAPAKECPECDRLLAVSVKTCDYCGYEFPVIVNPKEAIFVELQALTYTQIQEKVKTATFEDLEDIQQAKGFSKGWIFHQLQTEEDLKKYAEHKGYKPAWVEHQINLRTKTE